MKKANRIIAITLAAVGSLSVATGCFKKNKGGNGDTQEKLYFSYSIGLKSNASTIEINSGRIEKVEVYDNGIDTSGRSYTYSSTNPSVATIDSSGKITPVAPGRVNFVVTEGKSGKQKALKKEIQVVAHSEESAGGYNYSGGTTTPELAKRAEILGKLEKYAMDSHLTGITLFDNGGLVKYSDRVRIPTQNEEYIEGYGFGILSEGELDPSKPLTGNEGGTTDPTFYHSAIGQDSLKINQYSATGSQVSDLASYITSSYWSTKLNATHDNYEWYPALAKDTVKAPVFDEAGNVVSYKASAKNSAPIPAEEENSTGLYRKWRIYVKTNDKFTPGLKYKTVSSALSSFNNRGVSIDDYEFIYQLLLTGSNSIIRGTEMANDTSYGIKGAQRYYNETKSITDGAKIQEKWDEFVNSGKLGLKTGYDAENDSHYIDIELINAIDSFTAMYTLSSSLTSPLPRDLFVHKDPEHNKTAIADSMKEAIKIYGTFNNGGHNKILDYTLCLGAYTLTKWTKLSEIEFTTNQDWFERRAEYGSRYKIPGVYYRVIDSSQDTEKNWKQFNAGNLDSAGVPSSKVKEQESKAKRTKGDATFKLNVNSCTQEQWDKLFGPNGTIAQNKNWTVKPWMSNDNFLDGLFYSINRQEFASKRGVSPSINYFSDAYQMRNAEGGSSYNNTQAHKDAVKGYSEDYGYNLDKAIDCFRNAVKELSNEGKLVMGSSKANPKVINIEIIWMYQTDIKEYGDDIKAYFEKAFNDDAVCGGKVKLEVLQDAVTNWEEVYNDHMMVGQFDLGFGAISGNTYNPLNFMEVLKSDNSSSFTLNWGTDTSVVDEKNPIIYDGQKWSFDALWEVADHGGIVENGVKIDPVRSCTANRPTKLDDSGFEQDLYKGFKLELPVEFAEFSEEGKKASFEINRVDCYVFGRGNITLAEKGDASLVYDKANKKVKVTVSAEKAQDINDAIKEQHGWTSAPYNPSWHENPFIMTQLSKLFSWELYYELKIGDGSASVNYAEVKAAN